MDYCILSRKAYIALPAELFSLKPFWVSGGMLFLTANAMNLLYVNFSKLPLKKIKGTFICNFVCYS
jgi:hypothetical protein